MSSKRSHPEAFKPTTESSSRFPHRPFDVFVTSTRSPFSTIHLSQKKPTRQPRRRRRGNDPLTKYENGNRRQSWCRGWASKWCPFRSLHNKRRRRDGGWPLNLILNSFQSPIWLFIFKIKPPLLPAFFSKNLPFWPNSNKIHPPPKNPFFTKKERTCVNFATNWPFCLPLGFFSKPSILTQ